MNHYRYGRLATLLSAAALMTACGGGGSGQSTAPLTLSVTDSAIDPTVVESVCIDFTQITLRYAGQPDVILDYDPDVSEVAPETHCVSGAWDGLAPPPPVRLDALGGTLSVALVQRLQVPTGKLSWIRLGFSDGSFVQETGGGQYPLRCPSCEILDNNDGRGFKLNNSVNVPEGGIALTVDIDLMKSLHMDSSGYVLRPTARLGVDETLGLIGGEVADTLIPAQGGTAYSGMTIETGCRVYVYAGHDAVPDDHYDGSPVVSIARVRYVESTGAYRYAAGSLPGGTEATPDPYTVALTCDPDDPMANEGLTFTGVQNADVVAGQVDTRNFGP